ncbi:ABC transporter permease [Rathayibacter tanaceti]|uniref:FtsX-like permease family protein n=2 Tax=Rathayibacter tanaceti TaxID=1671680 RepID=A0A162GEA9_9MICO|nr:FtsX-like permease family protein [Rathayibacter tanaceti]KZX19769.1 outer membrane-specific lipoprotein transporter subunit LolC [Rathayibacter tanaceti]QHC54339.1 FtsX-like permease family protein [Rathayibacter tanaceti]TCO38018.1 putative ABC transport system permease protein [Rathayibacter tanaceti]
MSGVRTGTAQGGGAVITVSALAAAFGGFLVMSVVDMVAAMQAARLDGIEQLATILFAVGFLLFGIAVYVGGVVTANAVSTVIAGRTREIALLRLLGASGRALRGEVVRSGLAQGAIGAAIGLAVSVVLVAGGAEIAMLTGAVKRFEYPILSVGLLLPGAAVIVASVIASWSGSRRVLSVAPSQAAGSSAEPRYDELRGRTSRNILASILLVIGLGLLATGVVVGLLASPLGLILCLFGGMASFSAIILGAPVLLPPLISLIGRVFGRGPVARLAAENAVRNPARSARAVIGLVIGVALVTTFAVGAATFSTMMGMASRGNPELFQQVQELVTITTLILSVLIGFSVVLATVGMVNTLSLSVLQRRRELGLLRALGFTGTQVRWMVVIEAAQMVIAASLFGLVLGVLYGWCGALAAFGGSPGIGMIPPTVPVPVVAAVVGASILITTIAAVLPARRATTVSPVEALAVA